MATLKHCLSIHSATPDIQAKIQAKQKEYLSEGHDGAAATAKTIQDILKGTQTERAAMIDQINQQITQSHPEIAPKAEHPAITKVREETGEADLQQVEDTSAAANAVRAIAKKFKKKIVFFKGSKKANGFFRTEHSDTLFINTDGKNMLMFTFGHELTHALKKDNLALYVEMFKTLSGHVVNFDAYFAERNANLVKQGMKPLTEADMAEEFFADFSGEQFADPEFLAKLAESNKTLFDKFVELFNKLVEQIKSVGVSDMHMRKLEAAQDAMAKIMKEYAEQPSAQIDAIIRSETIDASTKFSEIRKDVTALHEDV